MHITLILGTMFAGKSSYVLEHFPNYKRYVPKFAYRGYFTRDREIEPNPIQVELFDPILPPLHDKMVVDEAQFLNDIDVDTIINCNEDYHIVLVALSSKGYVRGSHDEWQQVSNLIPHASEIIYLKATCSFCGQNGAVTHVKDPDTDSIGSNQYRVMCHKCLAKVRKAEERLLQKMLDNNLESPF